MRRVLTNAATDPGVVGAHWCLADHEVEERLQRDVYAVSENPLHLSRHMEQIATHVNKLRTSTPDRR